MKPQLLKVSMEPTQSLSVRQDFKPFINNKWHYHQEVELIHFIEGKGTQFVGDSIMPFNSGDIVLVGKNLPHYWRFDECYTHDEFNLTPNIEVAHFSENFLGDAFCNLPENKPLKVLLEKSRRGLKIIKGDKERIVSLLNNMLSASGAERIIYLVHALIEVSKCEEVEVLTSVGFGMDAELSERDRIRDIYDYTFANYRNKINLEEIAEVANISPNSFCRYFKSHTQKTFSQFLTEVKVGHACKLLISNTLNIKQVCYESGFNNFASFHKSFKNIMGKSPLIYQKEVMAA
ncbi:Transcriptional regulator, AraC family [Arcticibacter svalbardensis MN12-7]|uniref:Transcriptional regulator, AraC family n=1 Tax=Arcticibacter svalbardensis MN12-7 TaxID=1150600 RepID=R9GX55_9SPHI|nr:AraC family transcriptional regulator [Arcticibacter svalbardensis]EOR93544.1 Transcriptional regulator, AraC family [Arcticibacter svalbardensis MN12-7]